MRCNLRLLPWWWVLRWVWLGEGIWVIYLTQERGLTLGQALLFEAIYASVIIITELPMGMVADRWGRRVALLLGGVCVVTGFLAFGWATSLAILISAYVLLALADSNYSGADTAMLYDSLKATDQTEKFTHWHGRLNAVVAGAIAIFTVVGSLMVRWVPLWVPIVISAVASAPAIILAWFMHEPPRDDERHNYLETGRRAIKLMLRTPAIASATMLMTMTTLAIALVSVLQQQFLLNAGIPVWAVGMFVAVQMAASAGASWVSGPFGNALGLRRMFWVMPLLSSLALVAGAPAQIWLYPLFIFPSVGWNILYPHFTDYLARRVTDSLRASLISISNLVAAVCTLALVPLVGLAVDRLGLSMALVLTSFFLAAMVVLWHGIWVRTGDIDHEPIDAPRVRRLP